MLDLFGGSKITEISSVDRLEKLPKLSARFIMSLDEELQHVGELPPDEFRCRTIEEHSFRRCMHNCQHEGKCKFTDKSSISMTTAMKLIDSLTNEDIKKLSGLDDIKVLKGRDNWILMRELSEEFAASVPEHRVLKERIDVQEVYYQIEYSIHLGRVGTHSCNCLNCGCQEKTQVPACPQQGTHKECCKRCDEGFAILETLGEWIEAKRNRPGMNKLQKDDHGHRFAELQMAHENLVEYRSHLARQLSEGQFDDDEARNLKIDTAIIASDYKMKILSVFFRENQNKFFGKHGTLCLGFMMQYLELVDETSRKVVEFAMMLTDNTRQDAIQVLSRKYLLFSKFMPPSHIRKTIFRSDGARCSNCDLMKACLPLWTAWAGIEEAVYRITVAGGGKSILDGSFGQMSAIMNSASDMGHGYQNAREVLEAIGHSLGMAATRFLAFKPDRDHCVVTAKLRTFEESTLRMELDPYNLPLTGFKHSGYGRGYPIHRSDILLFRSPALTKAKKDLPGQRTCSWII